MRAVYLIRPLETVNQDDLHEEVEAVLAAIDRHGKTLLGLEGVL